MPRHHPLGPFLVLDPIGFGAMGTVYHAVHSESGARVAVKVVRPEAATDPLALQNLASEIRAVAALDHPNIVRIYDVGLVTDDEAQAGPELFVAGTPWFAMEAADHGSLRRRIRGLDGAGLVEVLLQLLDALSHAHARGILHLDLKPDNVLFSHRSDGPILSDFGMGVIGDPDPTGDFVRGTPHFMAPEQVRGRWEELGPWTDLYAFGCLAWHAATGAPPMPDGKPVDVLSAQLTHEPGPFEPTMEVPPGFETWLRWLLAKDSDRRPRFAADAHRRLLELAGGQPDLALAKEWRTSEDEAASEPAEVTGLGLAIRRDPPLVGRTRERAQLWEALRAAGDGRPQAVVISGPRGSGKTRLARWLGIRAHERGAALALHAGQDPRRLAGAGGGAIHRAMQRAFPVDLRDWDAEAGLATRLIEGGLLPEDARTTAAWLAHGRVRSGRSGEAPFEVVCNALRAAVSDRPAVVLLDDAQDALDGVSFVVELLRSGRAVPVVFVLTVDDERASEELRDRLRVLATLPGASFVSLGPLSEQASHHLARRMLPLDPTLAFQVADRAGGSPGFTVELLHDLAKRKVLARSPHGLTLPPGVELAAPVGLVQASASHLAPLLAGNPEWELPLRIAACLGPRVDEAQWSTVCRQVGLDWPAALPAALLAARLWRLDGSGWRFLLPAMVESLSSGLQDPEIHRVCAAALALGSDHLRTGIEWERAGEPDRALDAWLSAAGELHGPALLPLLNRIREVAPQVLGGSDPRLLRVAELVAECSLALGWMREAGDAVRRLVQHAESPIDLQRARMLTAAVLVERQDARELQPLLHQLAEGPLDPADPWRAPWRLAWAWRNLGCQAPPGILGRAPFGEHQLEVLRLALLQGEAPDRLLAPVRELEGALRRSLRAAAAHFEGILLLLAGRPEESSIAFRAARRRYRTLGFECEERIARAGLLMSFGAGRDDEALRLLEAERQREATPRVQVALDVAELVVRLPRPHDLHAPTSMITLGRSVARTGMLDAELALVVLQACDHENVRPDRADAVRRVITDHRKGLVVASGEDSGP